MVQPGAQFSRGAVWFHVVVACSVLLLMSADALPILFIGDVGRYAEIATGPTFWIEQPVEFPPITAGFIWLTARWGATSLIVVPVMNLVLDLATAFVLARAWGRPAADRYLVLSALLLPVTLFRVDHLSVLLVVMGLAASQQRRDGRAGVLLAAGVLAKLWPAAVVGAFPRHRMRVLAAATGATVVGALVWVAAFDADALTQVVTFRNSRGWQIESLGGSILHLFTDESARFEGGAWRVGAPPMAASAVLVGLGVLVFVTSRRVTVLEQRHVALVSGLMLATPLLSPQFLLWLVPLVAILPAGTTRRQSTMLLGLAIVYSMLLALYYGYLIDGTPLATTTVLLRNLCLLGLMLIALRPGPTSPTGPDVETPAEADSIATRPTRS